MNSVESEQAQVGGPSENGNKPSSFKKTDQMSDYQLLVIQSAVTSGSIFLRI
jgi:hypothetical protein